MLHLADLHIGKRVNEFSMLDDQRYILGEILKITVAEKPNAVIIAGDVYDKAVPSAEAVALCDWFLTELSALNVSIFIVSGNHDSPERIAFGAELMRKNGVYLSPVYGGKITPVTLSDEFGEVDFYLFPFMRPPQIRTALGIEAASYNEAFAAVINALDIDKSRRNVAVAHQFITGAEPSQSEELSLGGIDNIDAEVFRDFCYTALGHIHRAQRVGSDNVRYCGTPLKYSFSELGQKKSVTAADIDGAGSTSVRLIPLTPLREMRELTGSYEQLTARDSYIGTNTDDYLQITLTDSEPIPDAIGKLRTIYKNIMLLKYDNERTRAENAVLAADIHTRSAYELFSELFATQNGKDMTDEQAALVKRLIKETEENA